MAAARGPGWITWWVVASIVIVLACGGGQTAKGQDCASVLAPLQPCLPYLQDGGPDPASSPAECCTPLSSLLSSQPDCLCTTLTAAAQTLNLTRARALVLACKATVPASVTTCFQGTAPLASAPTTSPTASMSTTPPASAPATSPTTSMSEGPSSSSPSSPTNQGSETGDGNFLASTNLFLSITTTLICMYAISTWHIAH
ncbi:hypothetical protein GOP47_0001493 [Adiantum capillus-veneris]|uniref:Bifunctional inhibitor/plant lipid transfer protein/seed storage helical domain-containing protein n=1 Tax=Adiantum capillus-veneris TaxID=13818 RepID=A0A9D4V8C9_ADICA|nr:hypothetical protein GOP47_0001493 [Adiantum capillus-veneris]